MGKAKHTPAPWEVDSSNIGTFVMSRDGYPMVALIIDNPDIKANANLVASAPELLEALKSIIKCENNRCAELKKGSPAYKFCQQRIDKASKAIAKAEGK